MTLSQEDALATGISNYESQGTFTDGLNAHIFCCACIKKSGLKRCLETFVVIDEWF